MNTPRSEARRVGDLQHLARLELRNAAVELGWALTLWRSAK